MPRPKKIPALPTDVSLAVLIQLTGEEERTIQRVVKKAGIEAGRNAYPLTASMRALYDYQRERADAPSVSRQDDKARREKAEADSAEIDLAEKLKQLCFRSDIEGLWRDGNVKIRRKLQDAKDIPQKMKERVIEIMQSVKLDVNEIA